MLQRHNKNSRITVIIFLAILLCACGKAPDASTAVSGSASVSDPVYTHPALTMPDDTREFAPTEIRENRRSYELLDGDWVAEFYYYYYPKELFPYEPAPYAYSFAINNMRYRYNEQWTESVTKNQDRSGNTVYDVGYSIYPVKSWFSVSDSRRNDLEKLKDLLAQGLSPEQMLALDEDSLQFEELDKDLFFRLMRKALTDNQKTEKDVPSRQLDYYYSMEYENDYSDGYKLQVCYFGAGGNMGQDCYLEKIVIDVLYKTGEKYNEYDQLSDLVKDGKASAEQQEAYALIRKIEDAVVAQNRFSALSAEYEDLEIGGIDFSRLWQFMQDLETGDILYDEARSAMYGAEDDLPFFRKEMTPEEFATREAPKGIGEMP